MVACFLNPLLLKSTLSNLENKDDTDKDTGPLLSLFNQFYQIGLRAARGPCTYLHVLFLNCIQFRERSYSSTQNHYYYQNNISQSNVRILSCQKSKKSTQVGSSTRPVFHDNLQEREGHDPIRAQRLPAFDAPIG